MESLFKAADLDGNKLIEFSEVLFQFYYFSLKLYLELFIKRNYLNLNFFKYLQIMQIFKMKMEIKC